jgi:transposase
MSAKLGRGAAVTATAHKLARLWYAMVTQGTQYDEAGAEAYEEKHRARVIRGIEKRAKALGYELKPLAA